MTIALRPARRADNAWLETWLPAVAKSVDYDDESTQRSQKRLIIERSASRTPGTAALGCDPVGVIIYRTDEPKAHHAIIELVATPPQCARRGAGMAAASLLEEQLRRRGMRRIYAPAAASHGIAMYFWIRLGYRPLLRHEWPCVREGVAWLSRDI
ncbi:MAG TPA: GNAT family N-acetyltransferase [Gemmatimonadaceae bacterium]